MIFVIMYRFFARTDIDENRRYIDYSHARCPPP